MVCLCVLFSEDCSDEEFEVFFEVFFDCFDGEFI